MDRYLNAGAIISANVVRWMRLIVVLWYVVSVSGSASATLNADHEMVSQIFRVALAQGRSYRLLAELCERYPHRLSGSPESNAANLWIKEAMQHAEDLSARPGWLCGHTR